VKKTDPELLGALKNSCPNAFLLHRGILRSELNGSSVSLDGVQRLESLFWKSPGGEDVAFIMTKYIEVGAVDSAKRFYKQALPIAGSSVLFSNKEAPLRWMISYMEDDKAGMDAVVKDSPSYSALDLEKHALHFFVKGDRAKLIQISNAYLGRYGSNPSATGWLARMAPLMDALKDKGHAEHAQALELLHQGTRFTYAQFVALRQTGLPDADCIKLLEGAAPDKFKDLLMSYLRKDLPAFLKVRSTLSNTESRGILMALQSMLRHQLLNAPVAEGQKDMKPAEETRLDILVHEAASKKKKVN
jgi:hypothetical protein